MVFRGEKKPAGMTLDAQVPRKGKPKGKRMINTKIGGCAERFTRSGHKRPVGRGFVATGAFAGECSIFTTIAPREKHFHFKNGGVSVTPKKGGWWVGRKGRGGVGGSKRKAASKTGFLITNTSPLHYRDATLYWAAELPAITFDGIHLPHPLEQHCDRLSSVRVYCRGPGHPPPNHLYPVSTTPPRGQAGKADKTGKIAKVTTYRVVGQVGNVARPKGLG